MPLLAVLFALLCLAVAMPASANQTETEIVCGNQEEPEPQVDANGILVEPDQSTEEDRASDYDDSGENLEIPEDEGDELTPEERAAIDHCLAMAADRAVREVRRALRRKGARRLSTLSSEHLPYGGRVDLTLRRRAGARLLGRARLRLYSGDQKRLRLKLTPAGRRALRDGRERVLLRLKLTDALSGRSEARTARVTLRN